jgi:hypothetical protein
VKIISINGDINALIRIAEPGVPVSKTTSFLFTSSRDIAFHIKAIPKSKYVTDADILRSSKF